MIGHHPDRLKNLYFIYAVVMRAINRAEPILKAYNYNTGLDPLQDETTSLYIDTLLNNTIGSCEEPFKESSLFARK